MLKHKRFKLLYMLEISANHTCSADTQFNNTFQFSLFIISPFIFKTQIRAVCLKVCSSRQITAKKDKEVGTQMMASKCNLTSAKEMSSLYLHRFWAERSTLQTTSWEESRLCTITESLTPPCQMTLTASSQSSSGSPTCRRFMYCVIQIYILYSH